MFLMMNYFKDQKRNMNIKEQVHITLNIAFY